MLASLDHLRPWMGWAGAEPLDLEERRTQLAEWELAWADGGDVQLGIFLHGRLAGCCGLHRNLAPDGLEIGYWIHPEFTGRGLVTRAVALLTQSSLALAEISHVEIHHDRANVRSGAVPRRLGYTLQGEFPDAVSAPAEEGLEWRWRKQAAEPR